jgi:hypothetical protein
MDNKRRLENSAVVAEIDPVGAVVAVCEALKGNVEQAREALSKLYPLIHQASSTRKYTPVQCMTIFLQDGFIDRYSGKRLVFPGTLRVLSILLPVEFPYHPNWKVEVTHPAFWELFPTIDHIVPVSRGGLDDQSNWATTSQLMNAAKANWSLDQLGWKLLDPAPSGEWDGLTRWCLEFVRSHGELMRNDYVRKWVRAAETCFATFQR